MALQSIPGGLWIPTTITNLPRGDYTAAPAATVLDATAEKAAVIFQVPVTGSIEKVGFQLGTVTEEDTLKVGLYTVDASGDPTTTAYGSMVAGTVTFADGDDNTWQNVTLGTPATATKGDMVAAVIEFNSWTDGNLNIAYLSESFAGTSGPNFPYIDHFTAAWAKNNRVPILGVEYASAAYHVIDGVWPVTLVTNTAFNSSSAADEIALRFQLPFPARLSGFAFGLTPAAGANFDVVLYSGTTALDTFSFDGDHRGAALPYVYFGKFTNPQELAANTVYRLALKPTTTTSITISRFTVPSAAAMGQLSGGVQFYESTRVDAGAWTDTTTRRPYFFLQFDQFDDGTGGGSGGEGPLIGGRLVL